MKIHILEMPLDFGGNRHGSDMGPSAIRLAGLKEAIADLNHQTVKHFSPINLTPQEFEHIGDSKAKYLKPITVACTQLAKEVEEAVDAEAFPLILGGDHSIVLGSLAGLSAAYKKQNKRFGVLYVDAHGDFNTTETSPSGNIHGMCMAASCGYGLPELTNLYFEGTKVDPSRVCYIGLRDIDPKERLLMKEAGLTTITMSDIDRMGFKNAVKKIIAFFYSCADVVHMSLDMDVMDPMYAPGVGIPIPGGLTHREVLLLMEELYQTNLVKSADIVEVNPVLDVRNQTARMAVEIISRILGYTIL